VGKRTSPVGDFFLPLRRKIFLQLERFFALLMARGKGGEKNTLKSRKDTSLLAKKQIAKGFF